MAITLSPDEPVRAAEASVGGRTAVPGEAEAGSLRFEYAVTGEEPEGEALVLVALEDSAGNRSEGLELAKLVLDFTPPAVAARELPPEVVRPGDVVAVLLTFSEPTAGGPEVVMAGADGRTVAPQRVALSEREHSFLHTVRPEDHGGWELVLRAVRDAAGNEAPEEVLGELRVDAQSPGLLGGGPELLAGGHVRPGGAVRVAFVTGEPVEEPTVRLELAGAEPLPLAQEEAAPAGEGTRFVYGLAFAPGHPEGEGRVSVRLEDGAGNPGGPWTAGPVVLDRTPPVVESVRVRPEGPAGIGRLVEVELVAGEPLSAAWAASDPAGLELEEALVAGARASWSRLVREGDVGGRFGLVFRVADLAGNEATRRLPAAVELDVAPPLVEPDSVVLGPSPRRHGSVLSLAFEASEPLAGPPRVRVGGVAMDRVAAAGGRFEYQHVVDAAEEAEGGHEVVAMLLDLAGNAAAEPLGRVTWDFTPPRLAGTPAFERCDGRGPARVSPSDVWLNRPACPPGNPALRVVFTLSEAPPPAVPPRVTVAGRALVPDEAASAPPHFVAAYEPSGAEPESSPARPEGLPVVAEVEDPAGNKARLELGTVRFDFTAPALDPGGAERVRYVRDPWGSEGSGYEPRMHVELDADALPEPGEVRVWAVTGQVRNELGSGLFEPGEALTVEAGATDHPVVQLTLTDLAGNESDADPGRAGAQGVAVSAVEWVGTLHGKLVGDVLANPHALLHGYTFDETPLAVDADAWTVDWQEAYSGAGRRGRDGAAAVDSGRAPWTNLTGITGSPYYYSPGLAHDERRGREVLLGGLSPETTWEWAGRAWIPRRPARHPPRMNDVFLFSLPGGGALMVGGPGGREVWRWDGYDWTPLPAGTPPPPREYYAAAYDPARGTVVLFGGYSETGACGRRAEGRCGDTWEWDAEGWRERFPEVAPGARSGHAMAHDSGRGVTLLFGGGTDLRWWNDTWLWDGDGWSGPAAARGESPSPRTAHMLGFDPGRGMTTLFGGSAPGQGTECGGARWTCGDTWEWDGAIWTRREPAVDVLLWRFGALTYDAARGRLALFGGRCELGGADGLNRQSVWEWDGVGWKRALETPPSPRSAGALAHAQGTTWLFGGAWSEQGPRRRVLLADTWGWEADRWSEAEADEAPAPRFGHALAADPGRDRLVLFGGCGRDDLSWTYAACSLVLGDTWEWDGAVWSERQPAEAPEPRFGHALATAPRGAGAVLFGGVAAGLLGDTHTWDGGSWTRHRTDPAPSARYYHAMAYDSRRDVVVLFGGRTERASGGERFSLADTWEWDGERWTRREPQTAPPGRAAHGMAYDAARGRTVMFGGYGDAYATAEQQGTWEWDGFDWHRREPAVEAPLRWQTALAYDAEGGGTLAQGGEGQCSHDEPTVSPCLDLWSYAPHRARPHLVAEFDLRAADTLWPTASDPSERLLLGATVRARSGGLGHTWGTGHADGARVSGYSVAASAFGHGGWVALHESEASTSEPEDWEASFAPCVEPPCPAPSPEDWPGSDGRLHLDFAALAPRGASLEEGAVALDYVELRLRYLRVGAEVPAP